MKDFSNEEKEFVTRLGKRIKELRMEKGYTNYEHFANEHLISRTQYGRYEVGDNLKILTLFKILRGLNVSISEFFSEGFEDL